MRFPDTLAAAVVTTALFAARGLAQTPSQPITVGETFMIPSAIMREDRRVMISLPESYGRTSSGYPVLFLLDGSSHIVHGGALVQYLVTARNRIPEMIVVALPNTNRNRDMTPAREEGMERHYRPFGERFRYRALPPPNRVVTAAEILRDSGRTDEAMKLAAMYARDYPLIAEQIVNAVGHAQLQRGRLAEGLATLTRNAAMFPDSPNVHDSLGDARCLNGDEKGALESRQNAVRVAERASHPASRRTKRN